MVTTKVFRNGNSQAIRIPQEMHTNLKEYNISKIGDFYIAVPAGDPWTATKQVIGSFSDSFMSERNQPDWNADIKRESL